MTFTKEQLQQIIETDHVQCGDAAALARELLESRADAEPVAWVMKDDLADADIIFTPAYTSFSDAMSKTVGDLTPLYTRPQPAPVVVPDDLLSAMEEVLRISDREHDAWHKAKAGIISCRAAMLQGTK